MLDVLPITTHGRPNFESIIEMSVASMAPGSRALVLNGNALRDIAAGAIGWVVVFDVVGSVRPRTTIRRL